MTLPELWFNYLIPIYSLLAVLIVVFLLIRKVKNKGKIPCLILTPFKRYSVQMVKPEGNGVKPPGAKRSTTYGTEDFYREFKPSWKFWRLPKEILIFGLNAKRALSWKKRGENELVSLWSDKEIQKYITKMVAKARAKAQLISNTWGIIIIALLILNAVLVFYGFNRIGVF